MKPFSQIILVSSLALMLAGCGDSKGKAESISIIGGEDGPTAVWLMTRLPWSHDEQIILRGTNSNRNCIFKDNGVAVPNTSERPNRESKDKLSKERERR